MTMSRTGTTSWRTKSAMSLQGLLAKSGIAAQPSVPLRPSGGGHAQPDRDGGRRLARLGRQLRDAPRRQAEGGPPDVHGGDDVAARVVDGRGNRIEPELVLADRGGVPAPADPGQLLEQRLELDDGPFGERDQPTPDDAQDLALGQRREEDLARRDAVERCRPAGPVDDRDEVGSVD